MQRCALSPEMISQTVERENGISEVFVHARRGRMCRHVELFAANRTARMSQQRWHDEDGEIRECILLLSE